MSRIVYVSLGSNVGNRAANLRAAIAQLRQVGEVRATSGFYETEPVELLDQPWFLNGVVALETSRPAREVLREALQIEREMGRIRLRDKGPRSIDLDILLYGGEVIDEPGLTIPHPAMQDRRFVLEPLAEIAPGVMHPLLHKTARELLEALPAGQVVRRLEEEI